MASPVPSLPLSSPRTSPRTGLIDGSGKPRTTLSNLGSYVPRQLSATSVDGVAAGKFPVQPPNGGFGAGTRAQSPRSAGGVVRSIVSLFEGAVSPRARSPGGGTSPRGKASGVQPSSLKQALATRGGVARSKDGFEVFYGVESKEHKPQRKSSVQDSRDGFDKFYGIQRVDKVDRVASETNPSSARPVDESDKEEKGASKVIRRVSDQTRQLETQLQARLSGPGQSPGNMHREIRSEVALRPVSDAPRVSSAQGAPDVLSRSATAHDRPAGGSLRLPRGNTFDGSVPAGVPTFPISSAAPLPRNVQTYSLCAPRVQGKVTKGITRAASANIPQTFHMAARDT